MGESMKSAYLFAAGAAALLVPAASASAAILVNGSLEKPGGHVRNFMTTSYVPGWTYAGTSDIYEQDNMGDGLTAADGTHYISFGHSSGAGGSITQVFATTPGQTYTLT